MQAEAANYLRMYAQYDKISNIYNIYLTIRIILSTNASISLTQLFHKRLFFISRADVNKTHDYCVILK